MVQDYKENYGSGWVSIYRSIRNHWIFENDKYFKWWVIILFEVNHQDRKFTRYYDIYEIKRGQSCNSLRMWSELFKTTPKTVSRFFDLLEKDKMIYTEKIGKGKQALTLITVNNYNDYQGQSKQDLPQEVNKKETRSKQDLPTNNNDNNYNNVNNENKREGALDFLNEKLPTRYEAFLMQNKSKVQDWESLTASFEDTINLEIAQNKIEFDPEQLMPRFSKFCRNWIQNQKPKDETKNISFEDMKKSMLKSIRL